MDISSRFIFRYQKHTIPNFDRLAFPDSSYIFHTFYLFYKDNFLNKLFNRTLVDLFLCRIHGSSQQQFLPHYMKEGVDHNYRKHHF